ncbi:MAG: KH domain-containing protein [Deferribacteraceae bacterium]|nr:KH domain-containing protein [Deferribacteraceae bacterium]
MKELLRIIAEPLVEKPNDINITETEKEGVIVLELRVNEVDLGKVIGKQGRTAKAIRTILNAASTRQGKKVTMEIMD